MDLLRIYSFAKSYHKYKIRFFYYNNKGNTDFYWDEKIADKQADAIFKKSINSDFLVREFKKIKTIINEFNQLIKKLKRQNFLAMSDEELYKNYLLFHKMVYRGGLCAVFIRIFVYKAEPFLQLELEKKYKIKTSEIFCILTSSNRQSFTQREEVELLKIVLAVISGKKDIDSKFVDSAIMQHLKKYAYIPCGYFNEKSYSYNDIKNRIEKLIRLDIKQIKIKIKACEKKSAPQKNKYLRQNIRLEKIIKGIEESIFLKENVRGKINQLTYYSQPLFEAIAGRIKLSIQDFKMLTPSEFKGAMINKIDYKKIIKDRSCFIVCNKGNEINIYNGLKAKKMFKFFSKDIISFSSSGIQGSCANPGIVRGVARVVKYFTEEIKNGNILVASMTTPEYLPAMKKASAIITDEGGITCHAAIVAREMNKPCIIGTKIATQVLRDGDLVEVDADKGVVKILKRKIKI